MTYSIHRAPIALIILLVTFFVLFVLPTRADAYVKTGESTIKADGSIIFLMDYVFGHEKHEIGMPVIARDTDGALPSMLSYQIFDETGARVAGRAIGIVLSSARVDGTGEYVVPKGHSRKFTLMVIFTPEKNNAVSKYRLQVTSLPFYFDKTQLLRLNPSELTHYTTALVTP
ncbi:MAG TPA: hypothetical protein VFS75_00685 [Candidatus Paceibacterota bacterium]|nr:hypothetical protein [Candidatus Paceibacterota bacterium]